MRRLSKSKSINLALCGVIFIATSCTKETFNTTNTEGAKATGSEYASKSNSSHKFNNFSGEELFRGIFFLDGPVTNMIPNLRPFEVNRFLKSNSERVELNRICDMIIAEINNTNPSFLSDFRLSILSGDPVTISNEFDTASGVLIHAISNLKELSNALEYSSEADVISIAKDMSMTDVKNANDLRKRVEGKLDQLEIITSERQACIIVGVVLVALAAVAVVAAAVTGIIVYNEVGFWNSNKKKTSNLIIGGDDSDLFYETTIAQIASSN